MFYLVKDDVICGITDSDDQGLPKGFSVYESDDIGLTGYKVVSGKPVAPVIGDPIELSLGQPATMDFYGSPIFKRARIKANQDPLLAMQITIALVADIKGDRTLYDGAIKSIKDMMRKKDAVELAKKNRQVT